MPTCRSFLIGITIFALSGCASNVQDVQTQAITDRTEALASEMLIPQNNAAPIIVTNQDFFRNNPVYGRIGSAVIQKRHSSDFLALQSAQLRRDGLAGSVFPQFNPSLGVDENANLVLKIGVQQLLFGNGKLRAQKDIIRAGEVATLADFIRETGDDVSLGITAYLDMRVAAHRVAVLENSEDQFAAFLSRAERRVTGGIADTTELASFQLKILEAQSNIAKEQSQRRQALAKLNSLAGQVDLPLMPPSITLSGDTNTPPQLLSVFAQHQLTLANLRVEDAKRRPTISFGGTISTSSDTRDEEQTFGINIGVEVPIGVGSTSELKALALEVEAAALDIAETEARLAEDLMELRLTIIQTKARLPALRKLVNFAQTRVNEFEMQFKSGTVSIEEAISITDTFEGAQLSLIDAKDDILRTQLEIANITGQLVPLSE